MAMSGSDFFGVEGGGEAKYEVSHVVGKGSYGIVWYVEPTSQQLQRSMRSRSQRPASSIFP